MKKLIIILTSIFAVVLTANIVTFALILNPPVERNYELLETEKPPKTTQPGSLDSQPDEPDVTDNTDTADEPVIVTTTAGTINIPSGNHNPIPATGSYNYGEALQKSILFYEFQRSGKLPNNMRTNWRGDSGMDDGKDVGLDLTGGWYDAGDHVKFNLPMAYTATMLAWSVYEDKQSYLASGELTHILENIKWANDYFIKCHPEPNVYYYQVGNGHADHAWWGPAEAMQMNRPAYKIDNSNPGSTVAAGTAAALASCAMVFKEYDKAYADECIKHAKELFDFAERTKSDSGYTAANDFYRSWSGWNDELAMAAIWLYKATGESTYLTKAKTYIELAANGDYHQWGHCWDNQTVGAALLIAMETDEQKYKDMVEKNLDFWMRGGGIHYTPKGLAWLTEWGSLRHSTTMAYIAGVYSQYSGCPSSKKDTYWNFAVEQINYALGSAGRSYVIGFGVNPPVNPHHRTAQGSWTDNMNNPSPGRHVLVGALVGGPGRNDEYTDRVSDYVANEVACDYNAGLVAALAKLYGVYGGTLIPNLNAIEQVGDELYVEACINSSGSNYIEIKAVVYNTSGWPARVTDNLKLRYFFDLSEINSNTGLITINTNYMQGGTANPVIQHYSGSIYYVEIDFSGYKIYPGGQSQHKCEVQFRISSSGAWDNNNDPSFQGVGSSGNLQRANSIALYEGDTLVFGTEP
ncbi:MAG: glycoside hydrolase family 9 protein [Oscillospiraceae bacterium]|nr:glycoside hydrolase family 9 protein [Oscillospiraceae bacterium]